MRFQPGNKFSRGRPKSSRNKATGELSEAAREILDEHFRPAMERLLRSRNPMVLLQVLKFLADRAYGKAPLIASGGGIDPDSPQGLFMQLANQPIPPRPQRPPRPFDQNS